MQVFSTTRMEKSRSAMFRTVIKIRIGINHAANNSRATNFLTALSRHKKLFHVHYFNIIIDYFIVIYLIFFIAALNKNVFQKLRTNCDIPNYSNGNNKT